MKHSLPYGSGSVAFEVPGGTLAARLEPDPSSTRVLPRESLEQALRDPIGTPPLSELARGRRSATILIPGKTRLAGTAEYVPALLDELHAAGLGDDRVSVCLATGTHEHHGHDDLVELLGADVASRVRCVAHDCRDPGALTTLGTTAAGTRVEINSDVLRAELKILTGRVVPHYFAGFSGGRKVLVPGVAGIETIEANHRLTLDAARGIHPGARPCSLDRNPVHRDMLEAAAMAEPDFCLGTLLDARGRWISAVAGDWRAAHETACREAERRFRLLLDEPVDLLVTSSGGLPHDCNFMQALKAVMNLQTIVRPGGAILWIAESAGGMHSQFLDWAAIEDDDELDRAVRRDYSLTGHNSIMLRRLVRAHDVWLLSALLRDDVERLGVKAVDSPERALGLITAGLGTNFRYAVAPAANVICAGLTPRP